jgi:hypothetical protein
MTSLASIKLFEAEQYAEDALARLGHDDPYSPSVAIGHATDATILAVDALCHAVGVDPPRRHNDAERIFLELIRTQHIPEAASQWRDFLGKANNQRSAFQYGGELTSLNEARRFVQKAGAFVDYVRSLVDV